jgi:hypothetical protein
MVAAPTDIESYRAVMKEVFDYLMTDKTASKETANKLKVELLRRACASDGACPLDADPPHEMSKKAEHADEEEGTLELAEDEDSFNVHDWFNFGNWLLAHR